MEYNDDFRNHLRDLLAANVQIGNMILSIVANNFSEDEVKKVILEVDQNLYNDVDDDDDCDPTIAVFNKVVGSA